MSMKGLQDRSVLVTGRASGIGRATAERLVQEGARVAIVDIDGEAAARVARELGGSDRVLALAGDVSREDDVAGYFARAIEHFGSLDALHNNAGIEGPLAELADFELEDFQRLVRINYQGVFLNLREMLRTARRQASPSTIVNTSSGTAMHGVPQLGAYGSTKAAILGLTRAAAIENAQAGVRVNAIVPGPIETALFQRFPDEFRAGAQGFIPQGRLGAAEEVAALTAFLLSDESPFITGAAFAVDGGEMA
jgi:NAD(P)-dependent dehydrogenase (short-subunit alcohol dehydrogenase family)